MKSSQSILNWSQNVLESIRKIVENSVQCCGQTNGFDSFIHQNSTIFPKSHCIFYGNTKITFYEILLESLFAQSFGCKSQKSLEIKKFGLLFNFLAFMILDFNFIGESINLFRHTQTKQQFILLQKKFILAAILLVVLVVVVLLIYLGTQ